MCIPIYRVWLELFIELGRENIHKLITNMLIILCMISNLLIVFESSVCLNSELWKSLGILRILNAHYIALKNSLECLLFAIRFITQQHFELDER